ncbi:hypothetical protein EXS65_04950, partial [Candidatus Peribacteria bacterium]|nr:hypothetical protein [Candidatus Peribacteria bacterium]
MANTEKSEPEIEMSPEQKAQYRLMLAETLRSARTYGGDETSFDRLIETGDRLDQWMRNTFGSGKKLDDEAEEKIAEKADAPKVRTIDSVLDIASKSFRAAMEEPRTLGEKLKKLSIVHSTIDRVLLPPGTQEVIGEDGTGEWKEAKTEPRIERLLAVLQEHGIFTDDLIVTLGITKPNMMRKESYALIEIPRIGREVLVCNQVGEATFVSRGHLDLQTYLQKTKEEIGELEGVERIVSPGLGEWETRVIEALLKDISAGETRKIDIKNMDALRRAIMEKCQTGKEWMGMTQKQRHAFKIAGRGEIAIATALGLKLKNACRNPYEHALLGQAIYGSTIEISQALNDEKEWLVIAEKPEKLKELVRAAFPTAKGWIGMINKQMTEFKISGRGERAIATALGLKLKNPCGNSYEHALLGQAIYGSTIEISQALNDEKEW